MKIKQFRFILFYVYFFSLMSNETSKETLSKDVIKLESVEYKKIEVNSLPIEGSCVKAYLTCNPSIVTTENGYIVICRMVNYKIFVEGNICNYKATLPYKTKNILQLYDKELKKIKEVPIVDYVSQNCFSQIGPEDCRIFNWDNEYWFTGCTHDINVKCNIGVMLGLLKNINNNDVIEFDKLINLAPLNDNVMEKNWLPFIINNKLYMMYSYDPLKILEVEKDNSYKVIINEKQKFDFSQFKGSAAPIPFKDGYLLVIHETKEPRKFPFTIEMRYFHRFIYLDSSLRIKKISNRFTFKDEIIEFVCGLTLDHSKQKIILGLGIWDREAYLGLLDVDYVWSLLNDI